MMEMTCLGKRIHLELTFSTNQRLLQNKYVMVLHPGPFFYTLCLKASLYTPSLNKLDLSESKFKHVIYWIFYLRMMPLFPKQNPQEACLMERKMICLVPPRYTVNNFTSSIDSILYIQIEKRLILFWCRFILKHEKFFFITYMYVYWQS